MVDAGWWIEDDVGFLILDFGFIQNSKFRRPCGVCVSMRSWGVLILDFEF
jgi:hypothetical protein